MDFVFVFIMKCFIQGRTVLHHAMENATKDIIELLIDRGVPVNLSCEVCEVVVLFPSKA